MRAALRLGALRIVALAAAILVVAPPGHADPWKHGPGRGPRGHKVKEYKGRGGPPPWAPAHGLRHRRHLRARDAAADLPAFGIDAGHCNRELVGAVIGGAAGGVLGSTIGEGDGRLAATAAGTVVGVLVGGSIGRWMDRVDQNCVGQVLERAPDGREVTWSEGADGPRYRVVPTRTYRAGDGTYCRDYQSTATIDGRQERLVGTACRQPDGSWKLAG
jgi:surface antigen